MRIPGNSNSGSYLQYNIGGSFDSTHVTVMLNGFQFVSALSDDVVSSVRNFHNILLVNIRTSNLVQVGYHKSVSFCKESANIQPCFRCCFIDIWLFKVILMGQKRAFKVLLLLLLLLFLLLYATKIFCTFICGNTVGRIDTLNGRSSGI